MYKWILIFLIVLILPGIVTGQIVQPGIGGGTSDSIGVDTNGDGSVNAYIYPATLKKGANVTFTVNGDILTIAGPAGGGTSDSLGIDSNGDGSINAYLYSTVAGAFHIKKGANITLTVAGDSVTIAAVNVAVSDSTAADVDTTGTEIAAALGFRMLNVGDTVTGTYNFSGNPLEFVRMIDYDDTITAPSHSEGRVFYDKTDNTLCYYNNEADVTMNMGQEGWVYARNITGSTILDGKIVYITGAVSSRPTIALAQADAEATSKLIGVATHDIETASNGYVTVWGVVRGINLSDFSDGDEVFLSAAVAGSLTTTAPSAPNYVVEVGYVIDASANGDLLVSTGKSKMLNSLGDVLVSGPATGNVLVYNGSVWANIGSVPSADSAGKALFAQQDADGDSIDVSSLAPIAHVSSDGSDHSFIDQNVTSGSSPTLDATNITGLTSGTVEQTHIHTRAGTSTIGKGNPIYATSYNASGYYVVEIADASDPAKMPAIAMADAAIPTNATTDAITFGRATGQNTDTISGGSIGSPLYVANGGGLTVTKPTGTNLIQKIGMIGRDHSSAGIIQLVGAGRTNDLPNIASANFWLGNGSAVATVVTMSNDATMDNAGAVTVADDSHNHVITNIDSFSKANLETQTSDVADYAEADGDTWTGVHDFGGATSLEIPNSDNPTTDANGEIAADNNSNALEVYIPLESESGLISFYKQLSIPIVLPDSVQTYVPDLKVWQVNALVHPFGIEIDSVSIQLDADAAYSMVFEEWSGADPPVYQNAISTVTTGGTDTYAAEAPDTDAAIDAGDWIVLDIPTTDVPVITVGIIYHVTEGN